MKNKLIGLIMAVAMLAVAVPVKAERIVKSTFADSADGTKSATAFVAAGVGIAELTDLSYITDTGLTSGVVDIRRGEQSLTITSSTASGNVFWFDNSASIVTASEYLIWYDVSTATYALVRASTVTTTSVTVQETLAANPVTADKLYSTINTVRRSVVQSKSNTTGTSSIWLPSDMPSALTIDGNTTSCRVSVSGYRLKD